LKYAHNDPYNEKPSIVEIFKSIGNINKASDLGRISPLVSQAGEFALVIDPPKPPAPPETQKKYLTPFSSQKKYLTPFSSAF
jgi:hypothetical protein